ERFPDPEAASDREIPLGEIEVDEEIVSEQLERLTVRDHARDPELHHRQLRLDLRLRATLPRVSRHPLDGIERRFLQSLPTTAFLRSPDQHRQPAAVERSRGKGREQFIERAARSVKGRISHRGGIDPGGVFHASPYSSIRYSFRDRKPSASSSITATGVNETVRFGSVTSRQASWPVPESVARSSFIFSRESTRKIGRSGNRVY